MWLLALLFLLASFSVKKYSPLSVLLAGFLFTAAHAMWVIDQRLDESWLYREVIISGFVAGLPDHNGNRLRFIFRVDELRDPDTGTANAAHGAKVRLSWYRDAPQLTAGQRWTFKVKLRAPSGFSNPGGFDYERWLFQERIVATGYVRDADTATRLQNQHSPAVWLQRGRQWLKHRLIHATDNLQHGALVMALAIGDRSAIEQPQWQRFIDTGTNHLLAISGLHISLVAAFAGAVARVVWGLIKPLQKLQRRSVVWSAASCAALCYAALAGFSVPTQRALLMFITLAALSVLARHQKRQTALALAFLLVCLVNPLVVLSAGFWMSFAAVAVLYTVYSNITSRTWRSRLGAVMRGHVLITVGLYPVGLLFFGQMSLVSPLANFFTVPVVGMLLTPAIFVASLAAAIHPSMAAVVLVPVDRVLVIVDKFLMFLSAWRLSLIELGNVDVSTLLSISVVAVLLLLPVALQLRWLVAVFMLPLVWVMPQSVDHGSYRVTFLDVGQGTAIVVRTRNHTLVYDTGPQYSSTFNAADAVILPYLRAHRIRDVDRLIVSHGDRDHSGGADELIEGVPVEHVLVSAPIEQLPMAELCLVGQAWQWDGVTFQMLHPAAGDGGSKNDRSCTLMISTAGSKRTLLAGDVEMAGEKKLLARGLAPLEVLLVPHHGSATSSGLSFVNKVRPQHAVHTTGFRNRYGFPVADVRRRYDQVGTEQYNTATSGAITFDISDTSPTSVAQYRHDNRNIWSRDQAHRKPFHFRNRHAWSAGVIMGF